MEVLGNLSPGHLNGEDYLPNDNVEENNGRNYATLDIIVDSKGQGHRYQKYLGPRISYDDRIIDGGGKHTRVKLFDTCLSKIFHMDTPSALLILLGPSRSRRDDASVLLSPCLAAGGGNVSQLKVVQGRGRFKSDQVNLTQGMSPYCRSTRKIRVVSAMEIVWAC